MDPGVDRPAKGSPGRLAHPSVGRVAGRPASREPSGQAASVADHCSGDGTGRRAAT
jgi:hypothetical protein